jgi:predicted nucleotidyltransferase
MAQIADQRVALFSKAYLPRLIERYRPALVLLFGSRARGTALSSHSDLDLLIVSEAFGGMPFLSRAQEVLWTLQAPFPVEVLCYTPQEYSRKKEELGIVRVASQEGVVLSQDASTSTEVGT